jgi:hypothetical protein
MLGPPHFSDAPHSRNVPHRSILVRTPRSSLLGTPSTIHATIGRGTGTDDGFHRMLNCVLYKKPMSALCSDYSNIKNQQDNDNAYGQGLHVQGSARLRALLGMRSGCHARQDSLAYSEKNKILEPLRSAVTTDKRCRLVWLSSIEPPRPDQHQVGHE